MRHVPIILACLTGCAVASADPPATGAPSEPVGVAPRGRAVVRYALARHPERADLQDRGTAHYDLGGEAAGRFTAGGWLSGLGPVREAGGVTATITTRSRSTLRIEGTGREGWLALRLRSFRPGTVRIDLDGDELVSTELSAGEWTTVRAPIDAERFAIGEHALRLRMTRGQRFSDLARAYLAVAWVRAGTEPEPRGEGPRVVDVSGSPALEVPAGWSTGHTLEVPAGARLRAVITGRVELLARRGEGEETRVAIWRADTPRRVDVPLEPFAGELVRLRFRAETDALLLQPTIITLDGRPPESLRRPRHVLLYLIDTLRADRLRPYAPDTRVRTPAFSRFAAAGAVFANARAQENWTKPSVATLLSSLLPWEHTAFSDGSVVPRSVRLLPQMLHDRGFVTAGFVANGYVSRAFGFRRGWDQWRNYIREGRRTRGELVAADVLSWLDERPEDQPFFLYVHAIDPHVPYRPPAEYVSLYDPAPYRGPVNFSRDATLLERIKTGRLRLNARDRAHLEALYDGEVSYQDAQLGAILDGLARRGLADDTMVVITADHGEELFDHGSVGHGHSLYDELLHVPLAVRLPGTSTRRIEGSVGLVDVTPTILDALGEPVPDTLSGRSLLPLLRGGHDDAPATSVAGFMEGRRSLTVGRFKLLARSRGRYTLFDLEADPGETRNLASAHPRTVTYLRGLLGLALAASRARGTTPPRRHRASSAAIDPELEAQLEALGYVGTQRRR